MSIPLTGNWSYPTAVRFGAGRISELAEACTSLSMTRPLLVTDPGLRALPFIEAAVSDCQAAGLGMQVFSDLKPNPSEANVTAGVAAYCNGEHDGVVAIGGGSAMDCGKCVAFMQAQSRPLADFEDIGERWTRADARAIAPVIAVPTTAGTGSEVGRAAAVTLDGSGEKKIIFHPRMMPGIVISDPALTVGLPPVLTAGAGMDALAHCFEAYCAPTFHPMSEGIAVQGMRLVKQALPAVMKDGTDLDARGLMLVAASMGAVAFQKGLGAVHSLSHPVGAIYDTHHGMTNAVFLPYVLEYNRSALGEKIDPLCAALGLAPGYASLMAWILALREQVGVPHTLDALGVDDTRADRIAQLAVGDPSTATNPLTLDTDGARRIFDAAMRGTLE